MTHSQNRLDAAKAHSFFQELNTYAPSPLIKVGTSQAPIFIKNETRRMGMGAFKALGGIYAVACLIADRINVPATAKSLFEAKSRIEKEDIRFVCASAGNHGRAVARGAELFGAAATVVLPKNTPSAFADRLRSHGADVELHEGSYEQAVEHAIEIAKQNGSILLADASWSGYVEPPRLVMEGYTVMALELLDQFNEEGQFPTHVYLQAGVGGLAGAIAYQTRASWPVQPKIIVVEPDRAPCLGQSNQKSQPVTVEGPASNMGRLDCKTPSLLALDILNNNADQFLTISDQEAANAASFCAQQFGLSTTPSGAAGLAALLKEQDPTAKPMIIITEGPV